MARKKKGGRGRPRQTEKVEVLPDESNSGSGSIEEVPEEPPIVHHKKFGEIRVQHQNDVPQEIAPVENIRVPVIVNGCLPQKNEAGMPERTVVFSAKKDLPLDGSVIIKPGCFASEIPPLFFKPIPDAPNYEDILRRMEVLEPRPVPEPCTILAENPMEEMPIVSTVFPESHGSDTPDMLPTPKSLSSVGVSEECSAASSPVISSVDSEEMCESPVLESKKEEDGSLTVPRETSSIRRSTRIRSIGILKQRVRSSTNSPDPEKPVKVKSRWRRSSELEMNTGPEVERRFVPPAPVQSESQDEMEERLAREKRELAEGMNLFVPIRDNEYKSARRVGKGTKAMTCDCGLIKDDIEEGEMGCGDDCLNRLMCLECGDNCALGERCSNKAFQNWRYSNCTIFKTEKKGFGLKAVQTIPSDTFIMEYVGEVINNEEFTRRKSLYYRKGVTHFFFMALKSDTIIDATKRGNVSRFINHSCDPNAGTQMWIVNGESRIGFFSKRTIQANEEITFDYKFQRYGRKPQECFCEAANCQKWIGGSPEDDSDESDEESDEEEEEEDEDEEDEEKDGAKEVSPEKVKAQVSSDNEKSDSDMDLDSDSESRLEEEKPKPKKKRGRKPKPFSERKAGRRSRWWRMEKESPVQDIGLEDEIQRLTITGVKNCAHTLMLCRLMVRAEDWSTRHRLLLLISRADSPCRKLFLDYRGLMFIHDWMLSADLWSQRLEILKMLQTLPISNRRMLIDSKLLALIEGWARRKGTVTTPSPTEEPAASEDQKSERLAAEGSTPMQTSDSDSLLPEGTPLQTPSSDLSEEACMQEALALITALLELWSTIKEEFRIPKKERVEQMKEHQREADLEYRRSTPFDEKLDQLSKIKLVKSNEQREKEKEKEREGMRKEGDRSRGHESPSTQYPDWFRNHRGRKMTQERRQMYALKVLREEEASRHRMQQEELWNQHKARCTGLGLDPNQHPAMDPISGCPIFFDHATRTWSQTPPYQKYQYAQQFASAYPGMPGPPIMSSAPNSLPYPMVSYVSTPSPYPGTPAQMSMYQNMLPRFPGHNVITVTTDQQTPVPVPPHQPGPAEEAPKEEPPPDAPVLTAVPVNTPMKLPPRWKAAKDPRGLVYYYHLKIRKSQWEPPSWTEEQAIAEAQRVLAAEAPEESSSESSETESEEEEEEEEEEQTESFETTVMETEVQESAMEGVSGEVADTTQPEEDSAEEASVGDEAEADEAVSSEKEVAVTQDVESPAEQPSQSDAMDAEPDAVSQDSPVPTRVPSIRPAAKPTKRRVGLVQERIISPRYDSADRIEMRKYKEKLKRRKEERRAARKAAAALKSVKKRKKDKRVTSSAAESSTDKKIKENFKAKIVHDVVHALNPYLKPDCKIGRITSSEDFKDLARRLTNYVMLKELSHCQSVDELGYNDSVKQKAKDFVKKYMAKFGPEYERRTD